MFAFAVLLAGFMLGAESQGCSTSSFTASGTLSGVAKINFVPEANVVMPQGGITYTTSGTTSWSASATIEAVDAAEDLFTHTLTGDTLTFTLAEQVSGAAANVDFNSAATVTMSSLAFGVVTVLALTSNISKKHMLLIMLVFGVTMVLAQTACTTKVNSLTVGVNAGFTCSGLSCTQNVCTCADGSAASGAACTTAGAAKCASCDAGFTLASDACVTNTCTCADGTGATGTACPTNGGAKCVSCDSGFSLSGLACSGIACPSPAYTGTAGACTCAGAVSNGAWTGSVTYTADKAAGCALVCDTGYKANSAGDACVANACTCTDGTGATGTACPTDGDAKCVSCDTGYSLASAACSAIACPSPAYSGSAGACTCAGAVANGEFSGSVTYTADKAAGCALVCDTGYKANSAGDACVPAYTCMCSDPNGVAAEGAACTKNGAIVCACADGYVTSPGGSKCNIACGPGLIANSANSACIENDECLSKPCGGENTCTDKKAPDSGYTCSCGAGYTAKTVDGAFTCENTDACVGSTCPFGQQCYDKPPPATDYTCGCPLGYAGNNCAPYDACVALGNPCGQGTCTDLPAPSMLYTCSCPEGFTAKGGDNPTCAIEVQAEETTAVGSQCDLQSWLNVYPATAAECMALILQQPTATCSHTYFNYKVAGDKNCGCVKSGAACTEEQASKVVQAAVNTYEVVSVGATLTGYAYAGWDPRYMQINWSGLGERKPNAVYGVDQLALVSTSGTPAGLEKFCPAVSAIQYDFPQTAVSGWENMIGCYQDRFAIAYSGTLYIEVEGTYWFNTFSDDSADCFIDNKLVISDPAQHAPQWASSTGGSIYLTKGPHAITSHICEYGGGIAYELHWKTPGSTWAWTNGANSVSIVPKSAYKPKTEA